MLFSDEHFFDEKSKGVLQSSGIVEVDSLLCRTSLCSNLSNSLAFTIFKIAWLEFSCFVAVECIPYPLTPFTNSLGFSRTLRFLRLKWNDRKYWYFDTLLYYVTSCWNVLRLLLCYYNVTSFFYGITILLFLTSLSITFPNICNK